MISIEKLHKKDFLHVHELSGSIKGIVQHPGHFYKIMAAHFGDTFFVAKEKKEDGSIEILGFMMGFLSRKLDGCLFVWQIAVSKNAQGKGVGSRLLDHTINYARAVEDCRYIMATVEIDNYASQKLFEKKGFKNDSATFMETGQEIITEKGKEAIKNYYGSGTDQIFYVLEVQNH